MQIWTNGTDYCVAESAEAALGFWCDHTGEQAEDYSAQDWVAFPDEKELAFWIDDEGNIAEHNEGDLVRKPASDWAGEFASGYLGSTEH